MTDIKSSSLLQGWFGTCRYIVAGERACVENLKSWLRKRGFEQYRRQQLRFDRPGGAGNKLYEFYLPEINCQVVMKEYCAPADAGWLRRMKFRIKQQFWKRHEASFLCCRMMYFAGVPVAQPLALWSVQRNWCNNKNYFLYRKIEAGYTFKQLFQIINRVEDRQVAARLLEIVKRKVMGIVGAIHAIGVRHGDLHGDNFLFILQIETPLSTELIDRAPCYLLDYDHCSRTVVRLLGMERFFNIRDISKMRFVGWNADLHELLSLYLGDKDSPMAHLMLKFWQL